jgi:hypothetical protein
MGYGQVPLKTTLMMKWTSFTENATRNALGEQQAVRKSQQKEPKISGQIASAKVQNGDWNLLNGELDIHRGVPPTPIGIPLRIYQFDATVAKLTILHPLYTILKFPPATAWYSL